MAKHSSADPHAALAWLKRHGSKSGREGMARYNIPADRAFGVPMRQIQAFAADVTAMQMDHWCRDFEAADMALRAVGKRNAALNTAAIDVARELSASASSTAQRVGRHALRELTTKRPRRP